MRWIAVCLLSVILPGWFPARGNADTLVVPQRYKTIQSAIDAARPYDRILVSPGVYKEQVFFKGIPLVVESVWGARVTVIDAGGKGPVVTFDPRDNLFVILRGFTLTGGHVDTSSARGAGIYCPGSPIITENVITGNRTTGRSASQGAGMFCTGQPTVTNNEFSDNLAVALEKNTDHAGGGLYTTGGWFLNNSILGNSLVSGRSIDDKVYRSRGAGAVVAGKTVFFGNSVTGNNGCFNGQDALGGGILIMDEAEVYHNIIRNNTARGVQGRGGGIYCEPGSRPRISCNVIVENFAQAENKYQGLGGGVYCDKGSAPIFTYNTVVANRVGGATGVAAGLMSAGADPKIVGCIFWDNTFWQDGKDQKVTTFSGVSSSEVSHSLVGDGQFVGSNKNFRADPLLADAYHLSGASPCVDAGESGVPQCPPTTDLDGAPRIQDGSGTGKGRIDVGADEYGVLTLPDRKAVKPGSSVAIHLDVPKLAKKLYVCAVSRGNLGIPLPPPDTRIIPLTFDVLFMQSVGQNRAPYINFGGVTGEYGKAYLKLDLDPDPHLSGVSLYVAGLVLDGQTIPLVTHCVRIDIQ